MSSSYTLIPQKFYNPNSGRNALGLVGGNDVSLIGGNLVDLESDLKGITRVLSRCPSEKYRPFHPLGSSRVSPDTPSGPFAIGADKQPLASFLKFTERTTKQIREIDLTPKHLPTIQMVSYPGVPMPEPLVQQVYGAPWRF